jgi:protease-4
LADFGKALHVWARRLEQMTTESEKIAGAPRKRRWPWLVGGIVFVLLVACGVCPGGIILALLSTLGAGEFGDAVAIIRVEGSIGGGSMLNPFAGGVYSEEIINYIHSADEDPSVKAIVVRINTPGGAVVPADEIYSELSKVDKPVIVSMGDVAASGGYYIACAADHIFANPATLTGSIGVYSEVPNAEELLEKLGVEVVIIRGGSSKAAGNLYEKMSDEDVAILQVMVDEIHDMFVNVVAEGRDLPVEQVRELADGRAYTGQQALAVGLIDELGNLPEAIDYAAQEGGITGKPRIVDYQGAPSLWQLLTSALTQPRPTISLEEVLRLSTPVFLYSYIEP